MEPVTYIAQMVAKHLVKEIELQGLIQSGNLKLPNDHAIFNMGSAHSCPSLKLGICAAVNFGVRCYAEKNENARCPQVEPYRDRQEKFWKSVTAEEFASQFILLNALKRVPYTHLRLNESGDFWGDECIRKADRIAKTLSNVGVTTYAYTSRSDLDFSKVKTLVVNGSGFTKRGVSNEFKIVNDLSERPKGYKICCGDCSKCNLCAERGNRTVVLKH